MAVESDINPANINASFPVPNINQSSQTFRDNFSGIQSNFVFAKNEIINLQSKTLTVTGDLTGTSNIFDSGSATVPLTLTLGTTGVAAGTYTTTELALTVNAKGLVTAVVVTPPATFNVAGTYTTTATNYSNISGSGTQYLTVPTFTVDAYGRITAINTTQVAGFGLLAQPLATGNLIVGGATSQSTALAAGANGQFLMASSSAPSGVAWTNISIPGGTITDIVGTLGVAVSGTAPVLTATLDFTSLPANGTTTLTTEDSIAFYDSVNAVHKSITLADFYAQQPFLQAVVDDVAPVLGGNLNTAGYSITTSTGTLSIGTSGGALSLNGQTWPSTIGNAGYVLTNDGISSTSWAPVSNLLNNVVSSVTAGPGLSTTPNGGITTTGSVQLEIDNLPASNVNSGDILAVYRASTSSHYSIPTNSFAVVVPFSVFVDSTNGSDTLGDGSFNNPFFSINVALQSNAATTVVLKPGTYSSDFTIAGTDILVTAFSAVENTIISGQVTINSGLGSTVFEKITFDRSAWTNADLDTEYGIVVSSGCDGIQFKNCVLSSGTGSQQLNGIVQLIGTQTDDVLFENCVFSGLVSNALTPATTGAGVKFVNAIGNFDGTLHVTTAAGTVTSIDGISALGQVTHNGGALFIKEANTVIGDYYANAGDTNAVISTSNTSTDLLEITNSSFRISGGIFNLINKTGTCPFLISNVDMDFVNSVLTGTRKDFGGLDLEVGNSFVANTAATGTANIYPQQALTWDFVLTGDTVFTINDIFELDSSATRSFTNNIVVIVRQDSIGGHAASFAVASGSLVWENSAAQPYVLSEANAVTTYEFVRNTTTTQWSGKKLVSASDIYNPKSNTVTPASAAANVDCNTTDFASIALTDPSTSITFSGGQTGQRILVSFVQSSSGNNAATFASNIRGNIVLSTTANYTDYFEFVVNNGNYDLLVSSVGFV